MKHFIALCAKFWEQHLWCHASSSVPHQSEAHSQEAVPCQGPPTAVVHQSHQELGRSFLISSGRQPVWRGGGMGRSTAQASNGQWPEKARKVSPSSWHDWCSASVGGPRCAAAASEWASSLWYCAQNSAESVTKHFTPISNCYMTLLLSSSIKLSQYNTVSKSNGNQGDVTIYVRAITKKTL